MYTSKVMPSEHFESMHTLSDRVQGDYDEGVVRNDFSWDDMNTKL